MGRHVGRPECARRWGRGPATGPGVPAGPPGGRANVVPAGSTKATVSRGGGQMVYGM